MKYSIFTLILSVLLCFSQQVIAAKIATFTTSISGGIASKEHNFTPYISFRGDTPLYSTKVITQNDEGITFVIASDIDDTNFETFIKKLADDKNEMLSIGHKIGKIKSDISNFESNWFNGSDISADNVAYITLSYSNLKFEATSDSPIGWTNFSYELTLSVYNDDNLDGLGIVNRIVNTDDDNSDNSLDFAFIDDKTLENLEGDFATKGGNDDCRILFKKTQDDIFIMFKNYDESSATKKSIRVMVLSSK